MRTRTFAALLFALLATIVFYACRPAATAKPDLAADEKTIANLLDSFNRAAARGDFEQYFSYYAPDAIFTGTDATERWNKQEFMEWAKPIFAKGRAWDFTALERKIYFDSTGNTAWFDELLDTQMKLCRGSGVLARVGSGWKLKQYILSAMVPNDLLDQFIPMKAKVEDSLLNVIRQRSKR